MQGEEYDGGDDGGVGADSKSKVIELWMMAQVIITGIIIALKLVIDARDEGSGKRSHQLFELLLV